MNNSFGYNYLGTLDDSVERFPWSFKTDEKRLDHSLAVQLITGRPILLNDGYLLQHSLCIKAILDRESLLWALIDSGFISIMSRGFNQFPLHEMPVRMSASVETMRMLINDKIPGAPPWNEYRDKLEDIDNRMRAINNFVPWPKYDAGSGFLVMTNRLIEHKSSIKKLGLTSIRSDDVLLSFFREYVELLGKNLSAPRTQWEKLAKVYADNPDCAKNAKKAHLELMILANEMYHYNVGVMLSGDLNVPISVETQISTAFDDLLVVEDIVLDEVPDYPKLNVPRVITTAAPSKLAKILDCYSPVGKARLRWLELDQKIKNGQLEDRLGLHDAADEYAKRLSEHLGLNISYKESEGLFSYVAGKALSVPQELVVAGAVAAASAGAALIGLPVGAAGLVGIVSGYAVSRIQKKLLGTVIKKVRIHVLKGQLLSESNQKNIFKKSESIINAITKQKIPSSVDMDARQTRELVAQYKIYEE